MQNCNLRQDFLKLHIPFDIHFYECSEQLGSLGTVCLVLLDIDDPQACDVSVFFWTRSPLGLFRIIRKEMNTTLKFSRKKNILMWPLPKQFRMFSSTGIFCSVCRI
jgi:hypothetical protein